MRNRSAIILAAGKGSRMNSTLPKVLHTVGGVPMIVRVIQSAYGAGISNIAVVVGHGAEDVRSAVMRHLPNIEVKWALQTEQKGTAHAVRCAEYALSSFEGDVWILSGDVPLLSSDLIRDIDSAQPDADLVVTGIELAEPGSYGRLIRSANGDLIAIREYADCTLGEAEIREVNAGLYRVNSAVLFEGLRTIRSDNAQSEYYLTDLVSYATLHQIPVACEIVRERAHELSGVNTVEDLERANALTLSSGT